MILSKISFTIDKSSSNLQAKIKWNGNILSGLRSAYFECYLKCDDIHNLD